MRPRVGPCIRNFWIYGKVPVHQIDGITALIKRFHHSYSILGARARWRSVDTAVIVSRPRSNWNIPKQSRRRALQLQPLSLLFPCRTLFPLLYHSKFPYTWSCWPRLTLQGGYPRSSLRFRMVNNFAHVLTPSKVMELLTLRCVNTVSTWLRTIESNDRLTTLWLVVQVRCCWSEHDVQYAFEPHLFEAYEAYIQH